MVFTQLCWAPPDNNDVHQNLIQLVNKIPGCKKAGNAEIDERMASYPNPQKNLTEEDNMAAVEQQELEITVSSEDESNDVVLFHSDTAPAFDVVPTYMEKHPTSTPADAMFLRRWRSITILNRFSSLKQVKLTHIFSSLK